MNSLSRVYTVNFVSTKLGEPQSSPVSQERDPAEVLNDGISPADRHFASASFVADFACLYPFNYRLGSELIHIF